MYFICHKKCSAIKPYEINHPFAYNTLGMLKLVHKHPWSYPADQPLSTQIKHLFVKSLLGSLCIKTICY